MSLRIPKIEDTILVVSIRMTIVFWVYIGVPLFLGNFKIWIMRGS